MTWPTDDMIDAAQSAAVTQDGHVVNMADVLAAATNAAPTVDGWVWCEHRNEFRTGPGHYDMDGYGDCPGPHCTLLAVPKDPT